MTAAGRGLAPASPTRPVQPVRPVFRCEEEDGQQAPHFRGRQGNQGVVVAPFFALAWAAVRVTSRKAWASRQRVICRCQASQRRTSY